MTKLEDLLPQHAASLHLTHNQHKAYYEKAADYLKEIPDDSFIAPGERDRCIAADSIWELQWYPNTPVGFCLLYAASLPGLLTAVGRRGDERGTMPEASVPSKPAASSSRANSGAGTEQTAPAEPPEDKPIGPSFVADVAYDFARYYCAGRVGCSNCGGLPHTDTCFVGRFVVALALDYNRRGRYPEAADGRSSAPAPQDDRRD